MKNKEIEKLKGDITEMQDVIVNLKNMYNNLIDKVEYGRLYNIENGKIIKINYGGSILKAKVIHNNTDCKTMTLKIYDFPFGSFFDTKDYSEYNFDLIR